MVNAGFPKFHEHQEIGLVQRWVLFGKKIQDNLRDVYVIVICYWHNNMQGQAAPEQ